MLSRSVRVRRRVAALAIALVLAACTRGEAPGTPSGSPPGSSTAPAGSPATPVPPSSASSTAGPSPSASATISGEFEIENTTPGGDVVTLETLGVHLERSSTGEATWTRLSAACETDPEAPVSFDDQLVVRYECDPGAGGIPGVVRLRAVVEATIAGSDQVFRLESELAR